MFSVLQSFQILSNRFEFHGSFSASDASFTLSWWFTKVSCIQGQQYEYMWSHSADSSASITSRDNSNINIFLGCGGWYDAEDTLVEPTVQNSAFRTFLVDSARTLGTYDVRLAASQNMPAGPNARLNTWTHFTIAVYPLGSRAFFDGVPVDLSSDVTFWPARSQCTDNAAFPSPTTFNSRLRGFSLAGQPVFLGTQSRFAGRQGFRGSMSGVQVYSRALGVHDVACMHERVEPVFGQPIPSHFYGCTDPGALNFMTAVAMRATVEDGGCIFKRQAGPRPCPAGEDGRGSVFYGWNGVATIPRAQSVAALQAMHFSLPIPTAIANLANFSASNPMFWTPDPNAMAQAGQLFGYVHFVASAAAVSLAASSPGVMSVPGPGVPGTATFVIATNVDPTVPGARIWLEGGATCRAAQWSLERECAVVVWRAHNEICAELEWHLQST